MATYSGAQMWHMLQGVGGGLESLSLNVGRGIVGLIAVSDHCQNIRRLSIAARTILGSCSSVWEALGGTLREVSLSSSTLSHFNLGHCGHFCPNVTHLSFRFTEKTCQNLKTIADLCEDYAERLLSLSVESSSVSMRVYGGVKPDLLRIAELCPNAALSFPLHTAYSADDVHFIASLGRIVTGIEVLNNVNVDILATACPIIQEVVLQTDLRDLGHLERTLRALLASHNVRTLNIHALGSGQKWCGGADSTIL